jgi:ATP-dependent helicase HrpB
MTDALVTPLQIESVLPDLREALASHNRCLLVAEPGAGKTTRVPLMLLQQTPPSRGRWLLMEPRRVAARLASQRMADAIGEPVGRTIGFRVRGDFKVSAATRLEVITQGILIRMLQDDPTLEGIAGLVFDEFHERSLDADLGLALALDVQTQVRADLRLLVMSATLDVRALQALLGADTPLIECPGRAWPVTTFHRPPSMREAPESHQATLIREALASHVGDVLVFLPGQAEIRRLARALASQPSGDVLVEPLHGQLPLEHQQRVLRPDPGGRRRVILATALAESSVTVPGVRIVVDAGLERVPVYQPRSGLTRLDTRRVNRASADQRRGRAGREAAGFCYRLWSPEQPLAAHREPEILQADLAGLAFELARWEIADSAQLRWPTSPPTAALASARDLLRTLGIFDNETRLTAFGRACARWPTHPRLAAMLETAASVHALPLACWLVAWLEEDPPGDDIDVMRILERRPRRDGAGADGRWWRSARQWARAAECGLDVESLDALPTLLARAYPDRIARRLAPGRFKLASGGQAHLRLDQPLAHAEWLVTLELDGDPSGAGVFHAVAISRSDLEGAFPRTRTWRESIEWDATTGRLVGESVRGIGELVIERRALVRLPADMVRHALLNAVRERGSLEWSERDLQVRGRLRLVRRVLGDTWPDVDDAILLATLDDWLGPFLDGVTRLDQLDALPLGDYLLHTLDWPQRRALDELVPTHLEVPSGSRIAIDYTETEPVLAVRLQEMFGQTETPRIVDGSVPLLIHLLSPAQRPVQVTRDLASFWATTYFDVRKDLRARYPKHAWPDDPLKAPPTARPRRRRPT